MVQIQTIPVETHKRNQSNDGNRRDLGEKCKLKTVSEETHQRKPSNDGRSDKDKKVGGSEDKHKSMTALEKTQKASNDDKGNLADKCQLKIIPQKAHKRKAFNGGKLVDLEIKSKKVSETAHKRKTSSDGEKNDLGDTYKPKTHPEKTQECKLSKGDREDNCKSKAIVEKAVERKSSQDDDRDDCEQEKQSKRTKILPTTSFRKSYGDQHLTYINYPVANKIVLLDLLDF